MAIDTLATPTFGNAPCSRAASSLGPRLVLPVPFSVQDFGSQQLHMPTRTITSLLDTFLVVPGSLVLGRSFFTSSRPSMVPSHQRSSISTGSWVSHTSRALGQEQTLVLAKPLLSSSTWTIVS